MLSAALRLFCASRLRSVHMASHTWTGGCLLPLPAARPATAAASLQDAQADLGVAAEAALAVAHSSPRLHRARKPHNGQLVCCAAGAGAAPSRAGCLQRENRMGWSCRLKRCNPYSTDMLCCWPGPDNSGPDTSVRVAAAAAAAKGMSHRQRFDGCRPTSACSGRRRHRYD